MILYTQYEEATMLKVARAVIRLNKHARRYKPEELVDQMKFAAFQLEDSLGYIATGGWQISAYRRHDGNVGISASVAAHLFNDDGTIPPSSRAQSVPYLPRGKWPACLVRKRNGL